MSNTPRVKVQLVRSPIGCKESHRATVRGLGLRKINSTVTRVPRITGLPSMILGLISIRAVAAILLYPSAPAVTIRQIQRGESR